ncbi:hypothetical protein [Ramlibacter alkalitolerans]|uniref:DUF2946 domain-containing protein n=1 Tax=Ramlibacter alkalitolerans TaxID=2039631 RepID=A0ABS1JJ62_9BURK|nr:hypothetical protein [Ramlibacter alkalitolerans]MBL0424263.1 hypothetical protein [Ramlibacter alkalitolerans]
MPALRHRLPRFAALVLLVWLFATGVAFAHTCTSKVYIECEDCCAEMKAVEAWTEPVTVNVPASEAALPLPPPVVLAVLAWELAVRAPAWPAAPPDPGGSDDIPITFLRLAL